ncbi:hypothetical protein THEYE_A0713 [Thermodesulfovibrio yellowstonii DSM 11347]|uniref:Uncharacterized protein n=1 Tax=Thermodesulfovibrio yellowstonii (strain ATCC 51303 / DSM 11347 / YP87) TaxID=289376 RepID=B5YJZ0_THEYD|nr:hypothetical protein THEYE_A0713 [Thermodesulfovibrio yellowstonii DSM 11347]
MNDPFGLDSLVSFRPLGMLYLSMPFGKEFTLNSNAQKFLISIENM